MIRYGTGFSVDAVFFTHFHADHYLGIIGFLRTLGMGGREAPLLLYGPTPAKRLLHQAVHPGQPVPAAPPPLGAAVNQVARLGGFLARRHDGAPGVKALWRGLRRLHDLVAGHREPERRLGRHRARPARRRRLRGTPEWRMSADRRRLRGDARRALTTQP